jgi:DeoR/GlpR family transcriptional regulator of sugar metabolism
MAGARLSKKERHELILSEIRTSAAIRISKLAKRIGVAGETIRRDLVELGEAGLLNRTYGGATISLVTSEPTVSERGLTLVEERARIGRGTVDLVENGQVVMIDGGSTTYEVSRSLAQFSRDLTVITNSIGIASVAGGNPTFRVIMCPGLYDHREGGVLGTDTVDYIGGYNADVAIIGASGMTADGPSDLINGSVAVKRAMMEQASTTILVATHDKFGRASPQHICKLAEISHIVTDAEPPAGFRDAVRKSGGRLHVLATP